MLLGHMVSFLSALQCSLDGLGKKKRQRAQGVIVGILRCSHDILDSCLSHERSEWLRDDDRTAANIQDAPPNRIGGHRLNSAVTLVGKPAFGWTLHLLVDNALTIPIVDDEVARFE